MGHPLVPVPDGAGAQAREVGAGRATTGSDKEGGCASESGSDDGLWKVGGSGSGPVVWVVSAPWGGGRRRDP